MDLLLFSQLEDARAAMFEILQDQTLKMQNKKDLIVHMAADIQRQIDENEYFKIDETIQNYKKKENSFKIAKTARQDKMTEFMQKKEELKELNHLERLRPEWQGAAGRGRRNALCIRLGKPMIGRQKTLKRLWKRQTGSGWKNGWCCLFYTHTSAVQCTTASSMPRRR